MSHMVTGQKQISRRVLKPLRRLSSFKNENFERNIGKSLPTIRLDKNAEKVFVKASKLVEKSVTMCDKLQVLFSLSRYINIFKVMLASNLNKYTSTYPGLTCLNLANTFVSL